MRSLILFAALAAAPAYAEQSEHCAQAEMVEAVLASTLAGFGRVMNDPSQPEADRDAAMFQVMETAPKLENLTAWIAENCQPSSNASNATSAK
ncbi:hypothetical protein [Limimaricola cinnabarinus]|uniref:hypothetical protein n=1 Tax=Limimaricola cinnabarinus TaxID=1125964 RepID=UPI0024903072|nr:hypothetical protein [Limimaricola cinnabarinus]